MIHQPAQDPTVPAKVHSPDGEATDAPTMHITVYSPYRTYYEGEGFSLSAKNQTGPFDILPKHHNFISLLSPCEVIIRAEDGEKRIRISGGLMHVKADAVIIFLDV